MLKLLIVGMKLDTFYKLCHLQEASYTNGGKVFTKSNHIYRDA